MPLPYTPDRQLDPPENKTINIECTECEGKGHHNFSECCGASIDSDMKICHECKDHSDFAQCERCDGTGEVEVEDGN